LAVNPSSQQPSYSLKQLFFPSKTSLAKVPFNLYNQGVTKPNELLPAFNLAAFIKENIPAATGALAEVPLQTKNVPFIITTKFEPMTEMSGYALPSRLNVVQGKMRFHDLLSISNGNSEFSRELK